MKVPKGLQPLIDDGVIDEVVRSLKSGKAADVRVPRPFGYFNDVLIMELVTDASGSPAPRLGEVELTSDTAREYHGFLMRQVVNAAGNNAAFAMLERDVNSIRATLGRFAPELLQTEFAREMWALCEQGELHSESSLAGAALREEAPVNPGSVMRVIEDAREEAIRRRLGREKKVG
jgi:RIO kinase 1